MKKIFKTPSQSSSRASGIGDIQVDLRAIKRKTLLELSSKERVMTSSQVSTQRQGGVEDGGEILPLITTYSLK